MSQLVEAGSVAPVSGGVMDVVVVAEGSVDCGVPVSEVVVVAVVGVEDSVDCAAPVPGVVVVAVVGVEDSVDCAAPVPGVVEVAVVVVVGDCAGLDDCSPSIVKTVMLSIAAVVGP
ncbi:hypothetical protein ACH4SK_15100 [Streptomyces inhibens]|uniref:hypothetical protein n=1 Tax=Streptomyces inhibens TaxID=2293571 RepID=UPI00378738BC